MIQPGGNPDWRRWVIIASGAVLFTVLVAAAFLARPILIPVALAVLIAFILTPVVHWVERRGMGRLPAVLTSVGVALGTFGLLAWLATIQLTDLVDDLPNYTASITTKVRDARASVLGDGEKGRFGRMLDEIEGAIDPEAAKKAEKAKNKQEAATKTGMSAGIGSPTKPDPDEDEGPQEVIVKSPTPLGFEWFGGLISPVVELFGQVAFGFILAVFMLLKKEDLRNRLIRLVGPGDRLMATTRAVDDASRRVSRFLFMQLLLNTVFGVIITAGLLLMGVKYALLWGFLATAMRYVPYIGTWLGLLPPVVASFAMSEGWAQPVGVIVLYGSLELISNNVVEPWLYGTSTGLSEVAQLVATAFWAMIWGPIGLLLAAPLTVCLLVLGKYVPQLQFLEILLGDQPVLDAPIRVYQRLAARDEDEALEIAEEAMKESSIGAVFDDVLIPALSMIARGEQDGTVTGEEARFSYQAMREITAELAETGLPPATNGDIGEPVRLYAVAARDEGDEVAIGMLAGLLDRREWTVTVAGSEKLSAEVAAEAGAVAPPVILIGSVPPGGRAHIRYLCKRLRATCPNAHIVVGYWGSTPADEVAESTPTPIPLGADKVCENLTATAKHLRGWRAVTDLGKEPPATAVGTPSATIQV